MPTTPLDPAANRVRYLILAIQAEGERRLNDALRARGLDLTATQSEVLEVLVAAGPLGQGDLASRLVCTTGNISRLIDRMVAKGLLQRAPAADDRRRVVITLTPEGRAVIQAGFDIIGQILAAIRALYTDAELGQLEALLTRLSRALVAPSGPAPAHGNGGPA
jgi:DNA-binding MarR family transcriptional regulator